MSFFVGIAFDDPTRAAFTRAVELARPHADLKWELAEKAHLTLVFTGETRPSEDLVREVAARHAAFPLQLRGAGEFNARVLWLATSSPALTALQADLQKALAVADEHGAYTPHVTIARAKKRASLAQAIDALKGFEAPPFEVKRITLFESRATEYRQLMHAEFR